MSPLGHSALSQIALHQGISASLGAALPLVAQAELSLSQVDSVLTAFGLDAGKLMAMLERSASGYDAVAAAQVFSSAVAASASGDLSKALMHVAALVALDPRRAETLESEPELASVRGEVKQLLVKLTLAVKAEAETRLEQAKQSLQAPYEEVLNSSAIKPGVALLAAERLMEAGGYANCVSARDLSQTVLKHAGWVPVYVAAAVPPALALSRFWKWRKALPPVRLLAWTIAAAGALLMIVWGLLSR